MQIQGGQIRRSFLLSVAIGLLANLFVQPAKAEWQEERRDYAAALTTISQGDWKEYQRLRSTLNAYPLAIYLDYFQLKRQVENVGPEEALLFLQRSDDSPLPNRFLSVYLRQAGKAGRWKDFLQVKPDEPNSVVLKCYYFRAQLAQGNTELAWDGASRLWVEGKSQPRECDPLFKAWERAGELTDAIVWVRLLNVFEARQRSLLKYVAKKGSPQLQPWSNQLLAIYASPETLRNQTLDPESAYSADIASYGLAYLARYSPEKALSYWHDYQDKLSFNPQQVERVEHAIAQQSLFAQTAAHSEWLGGALGRLEDDRLVGIRLRWALSEQDWPALEQSLPLLSESEREKNVWRYWAAVVQERSGEADAEKSAMQALAEERDYYGFLAADRLGRPYALNHEKLLMSDQSAVSGLPALPRIEELKYHGEGLLAHSEWYKVLQDTEDEQEQRDLAVLASEKGWHRMSIDAATRAEAWDALDQRFPAAYQDTFQKHAGKRNVPPTELMAIARRESAFFAKAQSPVGARGLMQIMPATGKEVAASLKVPHRTADLNNVAHNVLLGSAYYRQLLDQFGGNRIFALTAYNAGPHRVARWRHKPGEDVPVEIWVETIPYRETRNYVQAVLAYNLVFQYLMGDTQYLLSPLERQASY